MMKINKKYFIGISFLMIIILLSSYVSAFGISCAYHKDYPLKLSIGETTEINFKLQNMAGGVNVSAVGSINKGSEILRFIDPDETYLVPLGTTKEIKAIVSIPSDANIGDTYPIEITFTTVSESKEGTFGFGSSVGRSFNVIVTPTAEEAKLLEEKSINLWIVYLIVGITILILIILFIWFKLKKRKK